MLNPEQADQLATDLFKTRLSLMEGQRPVQIEAWLKKKARKSWIKTAPSEKVSFLEAELTGKSWARAASEAGTLVKINLGDIERTESIEIIDYLTSCNKVRLARLSYADAKTHASAWHAGLLKKKTTDEDWAGISTYATLADEMHWVEVRSAQALEREGHMMRHCVGSYAHQVDTSQSRIFSLRDKNNKPHLTVEATGLSENSEAVERGKVHSLNLQQIRGPSNAMPSQEQAPALRELPSKMRENGVPVSDAEELVLCGAILDKTSGNLTLFSELPKGYIISTAATFRRGVPPGMERIHFSKGLTLTDTRLDNPRVVWASDIDLNQCRADDLRVENTNPEEILNVVGMENVKSATLKGFTVEMVGESEDFRKNWQCVSGSSAEFGGEFAAMVRAPAVQEKIEICCRRGETRGVRAGTFVYSKSDLASGLSPEVNKPPYVVARSALGKVEAHPADVIIFDTWVNGVVQIDSAQNYPWAVARRYGDSEELPAAVTQCFMSHEDNEQEDLIEHGTNGSLIMVLKAISQGKNKDAEAIKELASQMGKINFLYTDSLSEPGVSSYSQGGLFLTSAGQLTEDRQSKARLLPRKLWDRTGNRLGWRLL